MPEQAPAAKKGSASKESSKARLGTFAGVFTPSILTILGLILFQRMGYIVGAGGLIEAMAIIAVATVISVVTSLSLSAIATNIQVRGGGDYYLISRTLGSQFGGAIGVVLFLAQAVSVAFYCIGFGEATAQMLGFPGEGLLVSGIAAIAALMILTIAYVGADLATKFQYLVMFALGLSLVVFFVGGVQMWSGETLARAWRVGGDRNAVPFWAAFAIFFPAVTGFTQGVSMSGDLRDPARSLPAGTFLAVGVSTVVYVAAAVVFAACLPLDLLATDYTAMRRIAIAPWLIEVGVIAATLSSAMASCLGAPRILQALARDKVIRPLDTFAAGSGPTDNPRRAVLLAGAIALGTIAIGNLNAVAAVVGMCFLLSYGLLNYATFVEARASSPAFRPRFRFFNAWVSLGGAGLCLFAGAMINPVAAAIAGAFMVALHQYLRTTAPNAAWADSRYAYHFRLVREHLMDMREGAKHPRDWRPFVLALCNDPIDRVRLLRFAEWIDGDSGFTTAARVLTPGRTSSEGDGPRSMLTDQEVRGAEESLRDEIREAGLETFARVVGARTVAEGLRQMLQSHGLGALRPNTILMSAHEQFGDAPRNRDAPPPEALAAALGQRRNLILLEGDERDWRRLEDEPPQKRVIDVWWKDNDSGRMCLLLAHLMTRSKGWRAARVRVHVINVEGADVEHALAKARSMLDDARIEADANMVEFSGSRSIVEFSSDATVAFVPLRVRGGRLSGPMGSALQNALPRLPVIALVAAGEDIDLDAHPDEPSSEQANQESARVSNETESE